MAYVAHARQTAPHQLPRPPVTPDPDFSTWKDKHNVVVRAEAAISGWEAPSLSFSKCHSHSAHLPHTSMTKSSPPTPTKSPRRKAIASSMGKRGSTVQRQQSSPVTPVSIPRPQMGLMEPARSWLEDVADGEAADREAAHDEEGSEEAADREAAHDEEGNDAWMDFDITHHPDVGEGRMHDTAVTPARIATRLPTPPGEQTPSSSLGEQTPSLDQTHRRSSSYEYRSSFRLHEDGDVSDHHHPHPHASRHLEACFQPSALQYYHLDEPARLKSPDRPAHKKASSLSSGEHRRSVSGSLALPHLNRSRPVSALNLGSDLRGRAHGSDNSLYLRNTSRSPASRPVSYIDLLHNLPYSQQLAPGTHLNNHSLRGAVGSAASLLDTKKTLEMYRANAKKTNDVAVLYEFAIFMINTAREILPEDGIDATELNTEAKHILQKLSDRAYPFAQYYLADGYFSGLFNKGKPDYDKAFPLFVAASKHGHAEAGYRAALCYEFGWGTAKSYPKAVQFYRQAASKNHPGAASRLGLACIHEDMGLKDKYREGVKWLKRAQESADFQYNSGPYELGVMHLTGYGDDIFKDEAYAAQLLTQSADLGHVEACFHLGRAYENGWYSCPRDAALSVHFYNSAATRGHFEAMMALCAWYLIGAEPILEKDEAEAFAWAHQAAETGYAKAEYAIGYFTEMGIGCRCDPLEANVWYVRAAERGNETAKQRLDVIRAALSSAPGTPMGKTEAGAADLSGKARKRFMGLF